MRRRIAVLPLLLAIAAAPDAGAQGNTVPRELVQALMFPFAIRGQPEPAIYVGRLPAAIPASLVPAGARPVGGMSAWWRSRAVLTLPQAPAEAIAAYRAQLERAGWRTSDHPAMRLSQGMSALAMCGPGQEMLLAAATARAGGGSELQVMHGTPRPPMDSPCSGQRPTLPGQAGSSAEGATVESVPFPQVNLPEGLDFRVSSSGGSADYHDREWPAVKTAVAPAGIAAHLLAQLRQAGWSTAEPRVDAGAATGWGQLRDARGKEWRALVTVLAVSDSMRDVAVRVLSAMPTPPAPPVDVALEPLARPAGGPVPAELAGALLERPTGNGHGERPTFVSGRLPAELAGPPLPTGARVVGGASYPDQATALIFVPGGDSLTLAAYSETLRHAGWLPNAYQPQFFIGRPGPSYPTEFCSPGGRILTASTIPLRGGGSYVRLESHGPAVQCNREMVEAFAQIPLPPLPPPTGAQLRSGGGGNGGSQFDWNVSAQMATPLAPAALVDHYAALLRQAGWTVRPTAGDETGAAAAAELRDANGVTWHGLITSLALSPTEREVMVRVARPQP